MSKSERISNVCFCRRIVWCDWPTPGLKPEPPGNCLQVKMKYYPIQASVCVLLQWDFILTILRYAVERINQNRDILPRLALSRSCLSAETHWLPFFAPSDIECYFPRIVYWAKISLYQCFNKEFMYWKWNMGRDSLLFVYDCLFRSRLSAQIEKIPPQDSFHASKQVCHLLRSGVAALFGPESGEIIMRFSPFLLFEWLDWCHRRHQHAHPVHLRRHGDPAHRDPLGLHA